MRRLSVVSHFFGGCTLLFVALGPGASAHAAPPTFALRAAGALEGPQGTLGAGPVLSGAIEWPAAFGAWGADVAWAHDDRRSAGEVSVIHAGAFARRPLGDPPAHPFVEGGVGVSHVRRNPTSSDVTSTGADAWLGLGWEMRIGSATKGRLDARYHAIVGEAPGIFGGGDLGDYFSVGASLAFPGPGAR